MKPYIKGFHTVLRQERGTVVMYGYTQFPTINLKETGKRIQLLRQQRGLSVRDMQQYFGFEYPQAIYKWQHGECLPTVDNLLALSWLLQVNMEDLLVVDREVSVFLQKKQAEEQDAVRSVCFCRLRLYAFLLGMVRVTGLTPFHEPRCLA